MTVRLPPKRPGGATASAPVAEEKVSVTPSSRSTSSASGAGWRPTTVRPSAPPPESRWPELWAMVTTDGYAVLPSGRQDQLRTALTGATPWSSRVRSALARLVASPHFLRANGEEQAKLILAELAHAVPRLAADALPALGGRTWPSTLGDVSDLPAFEFAGVQAPARVQWVDFENQSIALVVPQQGVFSPPYQHTVEEVIAGLAQLLPAARRLISRVVLNPVVEPLDAEEKGPGTTPRSPPYMTFSRGGEVVIYPQPARLPTNYLAPSLAHEAAHALGAERFDGLLRALTFRGWKRWEDAITADGMPPSLYGQTSVEEDIAETGLLYLSTEGTAAFAEYRDLFPRRFALLDEMLGRTQSR